MEFWRGRSRPYVVSDLSVGTLQVFVSVLGTISVGELEKASVKTVEVVDVGELLSEAVAFVMAEEAVVVELWRRRKKGILRLGNRKMGW